MSLCQRFTLKNSLGDDKCGRLNNVPHSFKDVHNIIPRNCKYINSHGKGGFSDVVKSMDLDMGRYPGLSWWDQLNHTNP